MAESGGLVLCAPRRSLAPLLSPVPRVFEAATRYGEVECTVAWRADGPKQGSKGGRSTNAGSKFTGA